MTHDAAYGAKLRLDEMRGVVMLGDAEITDAAIGKMRVDFEKRYAIQPGDSEMARAVQLVASMNGFHPVEAWLLSLKWDGVSRLDDVAAEILCVRAESEDERTLLALLVRRWFVSLLARALSPGCKADTALILEGAQGAGKSSFFRVIAGEWFADTEMALDKDAMLQLRGAWVYDWSELEIVTSRQSNSRVKAFMSSSRRYPSRLFVGPGTVAEQPAGAAPGKTPTIARRKRAYSGNSLTTKQESPTFAGQSWWRRRELKRIPDSRKSRWSINQARSAPTPIRPTCQIEHLSARSFVTL